MRPTWVLTVASESTSRSAISALERPSATPSSTSRSRAVSGAGAGRAAPGACSGSGSWCAKASSSRRVTRGATTASPRRRRGSRPAAASGGASLSRKPLAPARRPGERVLVEVERGEDEHPRGAAASRRSGASPRSRRRRASARPSARRRGRSAAVSATASSPSPASPTTDDVRPAPRGPCGSRSAAAPGRRPAGRGSCRATGKPRVARASRRRGAGPASTAAAVDGGALAHPGEPVAARGRARAAAPVVGDLERERRRSPSAAGPSRRVRAARVLERVGERLLHEPVDGELRARAERRRRAGARRAASASPAPRTCSTSASSSAKPGCGASAAVVVARAARRAAGASRRAPRGRCRDPASIAPAERSGARSAHVAARRRRARS